MEAAKGCHKNITARTQVICDRCNGKQAEPGTTYSKCSTCKGTGEVSWFGEIVFGSNKGIFANLVLTFYRHHAIETSEFGFKKNSLNLEGF